MNLDSPRKTQGHDDGFLVNNAHAILLRKGKTFPRQCRWCGAEMRWFKDALLCLGNPSCDEAEKDEDDAEGVAPEPVPCLEMAA